MEMNSKSFTIHEQQSVWESVRVRMLVNSSDLWKICLDCIGYVWKLFTSAGE